MPGSRISREVLSTGKIFYYRDFEGHVETKDRYFIVVGSSQTHFFCFTTSTSERFANNPYLTSQVTPIIPNGAECFRKACVVDCTELHAFDDIQMSSYLNSRRVTIEGTLSDVRLAWIARTVRNSEVLNDREKRIVKAALAHLWIKKATNNPRQTMPNTLRIPKFATEAEEADWWYEHRDVLAKAFQDAAAGGTLHVGSAARLARERATN